MAILTVGIDLAKNVFALHGVNGTGAVSHARVFHQGLQSSESTAQ